MHSNEVNESIIEECNIKGGPERVNNPKT